MNATTASSTALATGSTREQILAVARGFIETRSYLGFSFQDVADAVGVRKASLYHHFATKEALGIAVIRAATQGFKDWDAARAREPKDALESYFRMYRNTLRAGSAMCPAGALAPGWGVINDELRLAVQELRNTQVTWLTGVLGALASAPGTGAPRKDREGQERPLDRLACRLRVLRLPGRAAVGAHDGARGRLRRSRRATQEFTAGRLSTPGPAARFGVPVF
jgi:TetR/AcrR family transcriptional repressor of nem operon